MPFLASWQNSKQQYVKVIPVISYAGEHYKAVRFLGVFFFTFSNKTNHLPPTMKFALASYILALISVALAESVYFSVQDPQTGAQLATIQDRHSMSGGSFWFYGGPSFYNFDPSTGIVSTVIGTNTYQFAVIPKFPLPFAGVFMSNTNQVPLSVDANGKITLLSFFACSSVNDPYKYSNNTPVVLANAAGNNTLPAPSCVPINIYKKSANPSDQGYSNVTVTGSTTIYPSTTASVSSSSAASAASVASISTIAAAAAGKATFGAATFVGVVAALLL